MLEQRLIELNMGIEHINLWGKKKNAVEMGSPCKCKLKCFDEVSEDLRKKIFIEYWSLGNHSRQWDYIARYVTTLEKKITTQSHG